MSLDTPAQPKIITPNQAALEAVAQAREHALFTRQAVDKLLSIADRQDTPPELRAIVINPGNNGQYVVQDKSRWEAKSIAVLNPTAFPVYLGIGGVQATSTSRAPAVPPTSVLTLPVRVYDLELGCDPTVLLANSAVIYLFRYTSVQPLSGTAT